MSNSIKYKISSYSGGNYIWYRHPRHRQRLQQFYADRAERLQHRGLPGPVRFGAWDDQCIDIPYSRRFGARFDNEQEYMDFLREKKRRHTARRKCRRAKERARALLV